MGGKSSRGAGRTWHAVLAAAAGVSVAALAAIPAVMAAGGEGGETVGICEAVGGGHYELGTASETDFNGSLSGHGTHADDIVPPFTIENPGPDDPSSFPGRNWDDQGQPILNHGCEPEPPAPEPPDPSKKVRICHASSSHSNPYVSQEPAIGNNGDLRGGHLNHTGPVYPADDWGDIIPPYQYVDENGVLRTFPGYNWSDEGQAIYGNGCDLPAPPEPEPVTPVLECVEAADDGFLAHFGYANPNATTIQPPSSQNYFSPGAANRGQPSSFGPGAHSDVFQVSWDGSALTWNLTGNERDGFFRVEPLCGRLAHREQAPPPGQRSGRFNLKIDGNIEGGDPRSGTVAPRARSPSRAARIPSASRHRRAPRSTTTECRSCVVMAKATAT